MDQTLYFFNPEHDLALANDDPNFNAPQQAKKLAHDLACLPLWYAPGGSIVWTSSPEEQWFGTIRQLFPQIEESVLTTAPDFPQITSLTPWGWDTAICKHIRMSGASPDLLPGELQLNTIRQLSHRNVAIKALDFIRTNSSSFTQLPQLPQELTSMAEIERFAMTYPQVIFKAPWSGSGKGLCWSRDKMTDSRRGWCRNVIEKQGSVIAEPIYDKTQDFALEFECRNRQVSFAGYSLFETEKGTYRSNFLMNNEKILQNLSLQSIDIEPLLSVQKQLHGFIVSEIAPFYSGALGIDMFAYKENGEIKLHPCVEINLRMTMGYVARLFFDRFVAPDKTGRFYIDHNPVAGELQNDHQQRQTNMPLTIANGLMQKGYLALTPVHSDSRYRVRIETE
jgi:hypothetical protein